MSSTTSDTGENPPYSPLKKLVIWTSLGSVLGSHHFQNLQIDRFDNNTAGGRRNVRSCFDKHVAHDHIGIAYVCPICPGC